MDASKTKTSQKHKAFISFFSKEPLLNKIHETINPNFKNFRVGLELWRAILLSPHIYHNWRRILCCFYSIREVKRKVKTA